MAAKRLGAECHHTMILIRTRCMVRGCEHRRGFSALLRLMPFSRHRRASPRIAFLSRAPALINRDTYHPSGQPQVASLILHTVISHRLARETLIARPNRALVLLVCFRLAHLNQRQTHRKSCEMIPCSRYQDYITATGQVQRPCSSLGATHKKLPLARDRISRDYPNFAFLGICALAQWARYESRSFQRTNERTNLSFVSS